MCELRPARAEEAPALRQMVRAAYALYVPRLDREPAPMLDDYEARIAQGKAFVLEDNGALCGVAVLEDGPLPTRYFLSSKAAAGILRRAEARGKSLPPQLDKALRAVASDGRTMMPE